MFRNKTAGQHNFATVPRADIPRSKFTMRQTRKQAFDASNLIPIMCEEVLPGDTWSHRENIMARLATPIAPLIDDLDLETFYFFIPNRIVWDDWEDFITGVDTTLTIPTIAPNIGETIPPAETGVLAGGILDHFGLPPMIYTSQLSFNALPIFGYFKCFNEWFRDQNLQEEWTWPEATSIYTAHFTTNEGATAWDQEPLRINKRHDYFTSSLPWPQKGPAVTLSLGTTAPVTITGTDNPPTWDVAAATGVSLTGNNTNSIVQWTAPGVVGSSPNATWNNPELVGVADLAAATAVTINAMRLAFQTQKLLERDARGGSRYVEQLMAHWGVRTPDYRLQRPEYLGGSKIPIVINPVAQTAAYDAQPGDENSAVGNLGAEMHASGSRRSFTYAATEHGYILGLACVRATPTYQQGTRRHWNRSTRLDYYFPAFAMLGEQPVSTNEIWQAPNGLPANAVWGYQEAWAEMRYTPNEITGVLRSTYPQPLDWWHLSEEFAGEPALNENFITDKTQEVLARALATAPSEQWSAQIIMDIFHDSQVARLMPTYSVPGLIDHF